MKIRLLAIILLIILGVVALFAVLSNAAQKTGDYQAYIASARKNAENSIPYTSVQNYISAFEIRNDDEKVYREYLEQTKLLGDSFYGEAVKKYVDLFPTASAYEDLCKYYYDTNNYKKVLEVANNARELGVATETVRDLYIECFYKYDIICAGLDEAGTVLNGYAVVNKNGLYGVINSSGSFVLAPQYKHVLPIIGKTTAVEDEEEWYMVNLKGFKVARTNEPVDYLSCVSDNRILVSKNGKYGYADMSLVVPESLPYDQATIFKNGVAAVEKSGKWALIDSAEKNITDYEFDSIVIDEYNTCVSNGLIWAKKGDGYKLIDKTGAVITNDIFEDVKPVVGSEPIAVKKGGKWGFIDSNGNFVIEPQYSNADSFSIGLASVEIDGKWGYINNKNEIRIEAKFEDCKPFSAYGIAAVKNEDGWLYIKLLGY